MKYNRDMEVTIATYADGGVVASLVQPNANAAAHYHYMCAFDNEENARKFAEENVEGAVFFTTKKLTNLAKELNCGIVWPGMAGVAFVNENGSAQHVDVDELIKMTYKDIAEPNKSYGCDLVVDGEIAKVADIDFNKKYFVMINTNGHMVTSRTYDKNGKRRDWLVVATSKKLIQDKATGFGIRKYNQEIVKDTLSGLLMCFLPNGEFDMFAGIEYIDDHGSVMITKRKIRGILADRKNFIDKLCAQSEIYLDAKYFISADKKDGVPTVSYKNDLEYLVVSQRMDTMMKAFKLEGLNTNDLVFINLMSLREILEGCSGGGCDGIALCIDDNPDHIAYVSVKDIYDIGLDGDGDEDCNQYVVGNNEFMMAERYTMMLNGEYVVSSIESPDTGEPINVIFLADSEDTLIGSLEETGYVFGDEESVALPTHMLFDEFKNGNLGDCYGVMCFDGDGFYIVSKDVIIDTLEKWENNQED